MKVSELQIQNQLSQLDIGRVRSNDSTVQKDMKKYFSSKTITNKTLIVTNFT